MFFNTSLPIVNPRGQLVRQISQDELMAYYPPVAAAAKAGKPFSYLNIEFWPVEEQPTVPPPTLFSARNDVWYMAATTIIALAFTALGWYGGSRRPCLPSSTTIAQPICDPSTGVCR